MGGLGGHDTIVERWCDDTRHLLAQWGHVTRHRHPHEAPGRRRQTEERRRPAAEQLADAVRDPLGDLARIQSLSQDSPDFREGLSGPPTRDQADLVARALALLEKTDAGRRPIRLLGVSVHNFRDETADGPERLPFDRDRPDDG